MFYLRGLQDMPAMYWEDPFSQGESYRGHGEKAQFEHELTRMIDVSIQNLDGTPLIACVTFACSEKTCGRCIYLNAMPDRFLHPVTAALRLSCPSVANTCLQSYQCGLQEHRSFPSIITYIVFNEGWGQYETLRVVDYAKSLDASRLFDGASGWVDFPVSFIHTPFTSLEGISLIKYGCSCTGRSAAPLSCSLLFCKCLHTFWLVQSRQLNS